MVLWNQSTFSLLAIQISNFRWKEVETNGSESLFKMPNETSQKWFSAGIEDYCKVDCSSQFYTLLGFMFVAGN